MDTTNIICLFSSEINPLQSSKLLVLLTTTTAKWKVLTSPTKSLLTTTHKWGINTTWGPCSSMALISYASTLTLWHHGSPTLPAMDKNNTLQNLSKHSLAIPMWSATAPPKANVQVGFIKLKGKKRTLMPNTYSVLSMKRFHEHPHEHNQILDPEEWHHLYEMRSFKAA